MTSQEKQERAAIEASRGIIRDENGKLVRSKEWKKERVVILTQKIKDFETRIKNAKAQLKKLMAELQ